MKQFTIVHGTRSLGLMALASMVLTVSCSKDSDYDGLTESDGIDLSFNIAPGGLTLPFGSYDKIYLTELLDTADVDVLERYENGLYYIAKDGEISETSFSVDEVTVDIAPEINPMTVDFTATPPANIRDFITNNKQTLKDLFGDKFDLSILADPRVQALASLPTEFPVELFSQDINFDGADFNIDAASVDGLMQIDRVTPGEPIDIKLSIELSLPTSTQAYKIVMKNLNIELPEFIVLDDGSHTYRQDYKELNIVANSSKAVWTDVITVKHLDFKDTPLIPEAGRLLRSGSIEISTEVYVENYTIGAENIVYDLNRGEFSFANPLSVDPAAEISTIVLKQVTGIFNPDIDPVTADVNIDLGDDMDFLTGNETTLEFVNPQIHLNITNTSPVPVVADITLTADNGREAHFYAVDLSTDVAAGTYSKTITLQRQGPSAGNTYADDALGQFLSPIPNNVTVTVQPRTSEDVSTLTLGEDILVGGDYDLTVELKFDEVNIRYDEVIENLFGEGDDAKDVTDRLPAIDEDSEVTLAFTITNAIPLGLNLTISAYNYDGVEDPTLAYIANETKSITIGASHTTTDPNVQPVEFRLAMPRTADVRDLILRVTATGKDGELNSNQYIKLDDIKLVLKNLKVDLNDKD